MKKHWTQTAKGRARMREIALENDNLSKARLAKANGKVEKVKIQIQPEPTLSVYDWKIWVSDNEIRIRK